MLYFDAPTAGFSYAKTPETYKNSDTLTGKYIHEFLRKVKELKNFSKHNSCRHYM